MLTRVDPLEECWAARFIFCSFVSFQIKWPVLLPFSVHTRRLSLPACHPLRTSCPGGSDKCSRASTYGCPVDSAHCSSAHRSLGPKGGSGGTLLSASAFKLPERRAGALDSSDPHVGDRGKS
jgi:hypothetical protein